MIQLFKNAINNVYVTANELIPSGNTFFNILLENSQNHLKTQFVVTNISTSNRYDQFQIIETGKTYTNLLTSKVNLDEGSYLYTIYSNNLSGITSQTIVEHGLLEVIESGSTSATTYNTYLSTTGQTMAFLGNIK
jgi:hypothetical protein